MATTTLTSREFNQDVSRAKRAAEKGPVIITDRGEPAYVLLRHDAYRKLTKRAPNLRDVLMQRGGDDIDFEPPRMRDGWLRIPDLS